MNSREPTEMNYQVSARLYDRIGENLDDKQKNALNWLLREYREEDKKSIQKQLEEKVKDINIDRDIRGQEELTLEQYREELEKGGEEAYQKAGILGYGFSGRLSQMIQSHKKGLGITGNVDLTADLMANVMFERFVANGKRFGVKAFYNKGKRIIGKIKSVEPDYKKQLEPWADTYAKYTKDHGDRFKIKDDLVVNLGKSYAGGFGKQYEGSMGYLMTRYRGDLLGDLKTEEDLKEATDYRDFGLTVTEEENADVTLEDMSKAAKESSENFFKGLE